MHALAFAALFVAGMASWSLMEYLLHRFAMHQLRGRGIMSREHLRHHATSHWYFRSTTLLSWIGVVVVSTAVFAPIGWLVAGVPGAIALASGYAVGYFVYEWIHARAHLVPPRNAYTRWVRKHHFHHHYGHPMSNHGVTLPIWDRVFGTGETPEQVRVPRRLAMVWLLDDEGEVRPEHVHDYVVVGSGGTAGDEVDFRRAFANQVPVD